jgi:hypothetical protein
MLKMGGNGLLTVVSISPPFPAIIHEITYVVDVSSLNNTPITKIIVITNLNYVRSRSFNRADDATILLSCFTALYVLSTSARGTQHAHRSNWLIRTFRNPPTTDADCVD